MTFWRDLLKNLAANKDKIFKSRDKLKTIKDIELEKCKELNGKEKSEYTDHK